jgi:hypothetical protein
MTLTIELTPEEEEQLRRQAQASGQAVGDYLRGILAPMLQTPVTKTATVEELEQMFDALAEDSEDLPVLPPEAFEREALYEGRF